MLRQTCLCRSDRAGSVETQFRWFSSKTRLRKTAQESSQRKSMKTSIFDTLCVGLSGRGGLRWGLDAPSHPSASLVLSHLKSLCKYCTQLIISFVFILEDMEEGFLYNSFLPVDSCYIPPNDATPSPNGFPYKDLSHYIPECRMYLIGLQSCK